MSANLQFHFSAATRVEPFRVVESARRMPTDIFPFFLASRVLMVGVDATGMQGLDSHRSEFPLFHSAMKSAHFQSQLLRLPLGWIEYTLGVGGWVYDAKAIAAKATDREREFDLQRGTLRTRYRLAGVPVQIAVWVAPGTVQPVFQFRVAPRVVVCAYWRATLRTGEELVPVREGRCAEFGVERTGSGTIWFHFGSSQTGTLKPQRPKRFSLWLCDRGADMRFGVGCSRNFQPLHLGDRVFWDSHYIADGLLHAGGWRKRSNSSVGSTKSSAATGNGPSTGWCTTTVRARPRTPRIPVSPRTR